MPATLTADFLCLNCKKSFQTFWTAPIGQFKYFWGIFSMFGVENQFNSIFGVKTLNKKMGRPFGARI
jgi:hypothetical protein